MWHVFFRYWHRLASLRITAYAGGPMMQRQAAKSPYFNTVAAGQGLCHMFKQTVYGKLDIAMGQLWLFGREYFYQLRLRHSWA